MSVENKSAAGVESSLYPYTSLAPSLKIADAIKELGGARSEVSKSRLAAHFKEGEKSAAFIQRISSTKAFGMIVGRSDYTLSESAKRYYSPTTENDRSNALLEFLAAPTSFREIIRLFDGDQLPPREILANIFSEKLGVPESWKERAASFFENSAQFVGALDEKRFLRVKALRQSNPVISALPIGQKTEQSKFLAASNLLTFFGKEAVLSDQEERSFFLDKERTKKVTLSCPLMITKAEYDRIVKWIDATWIVEDKPF